MNIKKNVLELLANMRLREFIELNDGGKIEVIKMSYGAYIIQPYKVNRRETDDFDKNALSSDHHLFEILQLLVDNDFYTITQN